MRSFWWNKQCINKPTLINLLWWNVSYYSSRPWFLFIYLFKVCNQYRGFLFDSCTGPVKVQVPLEQTIQIRISWLIAMQWFRAVVLREDHETPQVSVEYSWVSSESLKKKKKIRVVKNTIIKVRFITEVVASLTGLFNWMALIQTSNI